MQTLDELREARASAERKRSEVKKEMWSSVFTLIGVLFGIPLIMVVFSLIGVAMGLVRAFVALKLYVWFIVPIMHTPPIPIWCWFGASLLIGLYSSSPFEREKTEEVMGKVKWVSNFTSQITGPLVVWGIAAVVHWYISK